LPPIFESNTITRFSQIGEDIFASQSECIIDRYSISTVSGTSIYTLPEYVTNIRRVTWKGTKLDPIPHRQFRENFPSIDSRGRPYWYVYNNIGQNQIKLYPTPSETISQQGGDLFLPAKISAGVIVEFARVSDYTLFTIPTFLRRRLLKAYVLKMCFAIEGPGQNIQASQYFDSKWQQLVSRYNILLFDLINKPRKLISGGQFEVISNVPHQPRLPISRYGISVDDNF